MFLKCRSRWKQSEPLNDDNNGVHFQFPLNISQVQETSDQLSQQDSATSTIPWQGRDRVPIPVTPEHNAKDLPRWQTPLKSAVAAELVLDQILEAIAGEGIPYVAISASDVYDAIFLAEQINERVPDAQIVLMGADSMYLHSEWNRAEAALVVSTYSLWPEDQDWSSHSMGRIKGAIALTRVRLAFTTQSCS